MWLKLIFAEIFNREVTISGELGIITSNTDLMIFLC